MYASGQIGGKGRQTLTTILSSLGKFKGEKCQNQQLTPLKDILLGGSKSIVYNKNMFNYIDPLYYEFFWGEKSLYVCTQHMVTHFF